MSRSGHRRVIRVDRLPRTGFQVGELPLQLRAETVSPRSSSVSARARPNLADAPVMNQRRDVMHPSCEPLIHTSHRHPAVELSLRSGPLRVLLSGLDHGELDVAIGPMPPEPAAQYARTTLFTDELVLVTAPDHPLADTEALPPAALRDEPFVCLPADSGLRAILDRLAAEAGSTPHVPFESSHLPRLRDLAAHGLGVALVARSVAEGPGPPAAVHRLDPGPQLRPVGLLHRRDRPLPAAAQACREFLAGWPARNAADPTPHDGHL